LYEGGVGNCSSICYNRVTIILEIIMFRKLTLFLFAVLLTGLISIPAQAQLKQGVFDQFAKETFSDTFDVKDQKFENTVASAIGGFISIAISLIGVVLLVLVVYAGFEWLTAGGNDQKVEHAKKLLTNAVIGLVIALSAFIISSFVITQVNKALAPPTGTGGTPPPAGAPATPPTGP
jgi:hypothetical protein